MVQKIVISPPNNSGWRVSVTPTYWTPDYTSDALVFYFYSPYLDTTTCPTDPRYYPIAWYSVGSKSVGSRE